MTLHILDMLTPKLRPMCWPAGIVKKAVTPSYLLVPTSMARRFSERPKPITRPRKLGRTSWFTIRGFRCWRHLILTIRTLSEQQNSATKRTFKCFCSIYMTVVLSIRVHTRVTTVLAVRSSRPTRTLWKAPENLPRKWSVQFTPDLWSNLKRRTIFSS